jgi:hypothetical protein
MRPATPASSEPEVPVTFALRGARSIRYLVRFIVGSVLLTGLAWMLEGATTADRLLGPAICMMLAAPAYLWSRWMSSRTVETIFVWTDGLEIRRNGADEKRPWRDVEIRRAFHGRRGFLSVAFAGRGFRLMAAAEGADALEAIASMIEVYRGRALRP